MTCPEYQELVTLYLLGDLPADQAAPVRAHLETCAACRAAADEEERTLDLMRSALAADPAAPARLDAAHRRKVLRAKFRWWSFPRQDLLKVAAVVLLAAGIAGTLLMPAMQSARSKAQMTGVLSNGRGVYVAAFGKSLDDPTGMDSGSASMFAYPAQSAPEKPPHSGRTYGDMTGRQVASAPAAAEPAYEPRAEAAHGSGLMSLGGGATAVEKSPIPPTAVAPLRDGRERDELRLASRGDKDGDGMPTEVNRALLGAGSETTVETESSARHSGKYTLDGTVASAKREAMAPLRTTLPKPRTVGTPAPIRVANLDALEEAKYDYAERGAKTTATSDDLSDRPSHRSDQLAAKTPPRAVNMPVTGRLFAQGPQSEEAQIEKTQDHELRQASGVSDDWYASSIPGGGGGGGRGEPAATKSKIGADAAGWADNFDSGGAIAAGQTVEGMVGDLKKSSELKPEQSLVLKGIGHGAYGRGRASAKDIAHKASAPAPDTSVSVINGERLTVTTNAAYYVTSGGVPRENLAGADKANGEGASLEGSKDAVVLNDLEPVGAGGSATGSRRYALASAPGKQSQGAKEAKQEEVTKSNPALPPAPPASGVNPWVVAATQPFSTFGIDVNTAAYTLSRNYMHKGSRPPPETVRTEEFVNFFDYAYAPPASRLFAVHAEAAPTPFSTGTVLLKLGVKGRHLGREQQQHARLTFVIDTSGSMNAPDRLALARKALRLLVERLHPADRVAIVQYDAHARLVLDFTPAEQRQTILGVLDRLQASGFTHLEEGLKLGYATAARGFASGAANRVILLTDGVANVGASSAEDILKQVEKYRQQGLYCSVFGLGLGTYDDALLQTLANKGNGVYGFMDSLEEARRVFVDDLAATLNVIASDVKIQVEFDPRRVKQYRQLGYESRQLRKEDFRNDAVGAGQVGSGQAVTALYEVELQGRPEDPLGVVRVRGRNSATGLTEEIAQSITAAAVQPAFDKASVHFRLAAAVAEFAELLRGSPYAAGGSFEEVAKVLRPVALDLALDQRVQELLRLVHSAASLPPAPMVDKKDVEVGTATAP